MTLTCPRCRGTKFDVEFTPPMQVRFDGGSIQFATIEVPVFEQPDKATCIDCGDKVTGLRNDPLFNAEAMRRLAVACGLNTDVVVWQRDDIGDADTAARISADGMLDAWPLGFDVTPCVRAGEHLRGQRHRRSDCPAAEPLTA